MVSLTKYLFSLLLLILFWHDSAFSQNIEKVTLVTDRNLYIAGEPIWFGGTYTIPDNKLPQLSKVLYVELFNNDTQVVASQKIVIADGIISGRIAIPAQASTGYYILRAYTNYQKNFPAWQFTSVVLSVINPSLQLPPIQLLSIKNQTDIAVMADGNIAFRIKQPLASKVDSVKLYVNRLFINIDGSYFSNGLGNFNFKVKPNDNITLLMMLKSGDSVMSQIFNLGAMSEKLLVSYKANYLDVNIKSKTISNKKLIISIINMDSGKQTDSSIFFNNDSINVKIPISVTGKGLLQITVKDSGGVNIVHTACYIPMIATYRKSTGTERMVTSGNPISIDVSDIERKKYPIAVSVVMSGTHSYNQQLLPAYIIENPQYASNFLSANTFNNKITNQVRISVSLQQEYLNNIVNDKYIVQEFTTPEFSGLTLQGKLINIQSNTPVANEKIYATVLGDNPQFHVSSSLKDGTFVIPLNFCYSKKDIYLTTNNDKGDKLEIKVDKGFCQTHSPWQPSNFIPDTTLKGLITQMYFVYQVNHSFNVQTEQTDTNIVSNRSIFGNNLLQILLSDYVQMSSTPEVFNELVPKVRVRKKNGNYELIMFDDDVNLKYTNPLVLVDDVPYNNINGLMEIQPTVIKEIDVINHEYVYGNNTFKGIVMITTNSGTFTSLPLSKGGVFVEFETLKPPIKFVPFSKLNNTIRKPNFANTLYWGLFNSNSISKQITIEAPNNIAYYEINIVSLADSLEILRHNKIKVNNKPDNDLK